MTDSRGKRRTVMSMLKQADHRLGWARMRYVQAQQRLAAADKEYAEIEEIAANMGLLPRPIGKNFPGHQGDSNNGDE